MRLIALLLGVLYAESVCNFRVDRFDSSDTTCSGNPTSQTVYNYPVGECQVHGTEGYSVHIMYCDGDNQFVSASIFQGTDCPVSGLLAMWTLSPNMCLNTGGAYTKASLITNTGNKYGVTWSQGWSLFFCQSLLFGACNGV